jgi:hypothetical protein
VYLLVFLTWTYFHWGGEEWVSLIGNLAILPPIFFAIIAAFRVAAQQQLSPRVRRAWLLIGISFLLDFLGEASWMYLENVLHVEPFPSIADFFLGSYPLMLGIATLPSNMAEFPERLILVSCSAC